MPLLEVTSLNVHLHTRHGTLQAVRDLSFVLERGDTLGVVGESGCGKSVTALALMGLLPDYARISGSIRLDGRELVGLPDDQMCKLRGDRLAMVFQEPMTALNPVQRVGVQVAEGLRVHRGLAAEAAREQAVALLDRVGIAQAAQRFDAYPHQFSGGQRQRITIAMALACGPDLLIADEPTTALDATLQKQILALLQELVQERGMAMLLVSHDLGLIARHARQMLVMYGGVGVEAGPTQTVFAHMQHPYTRGLLAARPRLLQRQAGEAPPRLPTIPGSVPSLADLPRGCPFAGRCPQELAPCATQAPPTSSVQANHSVRCWGSGGAS